MIKRILSIWLAIACVAMSMQPVFAESDKTTKYSEAVNLIRDLGIITAAQADPLLYEEGVTRAELAEIIVNLIGIDMPKDNVTRRIYTDVPTDYWAAADIEYLFNMGIMTGNGEAYFGAEDKVVYEDAVRAMVSLIGYADVAKLNGDYPNGYLSLASSHGLLKSVVGSIGKEISLGEMAIMIKNVLECDTYLIITGVNANGAVFAPAKDGSYMEKALKLKTYTGIVTGFEDTALSGSSVTYGKGTATVNDYEFLVGSTNLGEYLGMQVKVYYKENSDHDLVCVHVESTVKNEVIEIDAKYIMKNTTKTVLEYETEQIRTKKLTIANDAIFIFNGKKLDVVADADLRPDLGSVKLISNNDSSDYNVVIIESYENFIVDKSVATESVIRFKYGVPDLNLDEDMDYKAKYFMDGKETDFSSISANSVVSIKKSRNLTDDILVDVYISNEKQIATATKISYSDETAYIEIDGVEYEVSKEYFDRVNAKNTESYFPSIGVEGEFLFDYFGNIADYTINVSSKNYGYVTKCFYSDEDERAYIRLFTTEAQFELFKISNKAKIDGQKISDQGFKAEDIPKYLLEHNQEAYRQRLDPSMEWELTINQLIVYKKNADGEIVSIETAENQNGLENVRYAPENFTLNYIPKSEKSVEITDENGNKKTVKGIVNSGIRMYKNLAENRPYYFVEGKTLQFTIPTNKDDEKLYKVLTKLTSTDVGLAAPVYVYDVGPGGAIGAIVTNTKNEGNFSLPGIVDKIVDTLDEDSMPCKMIVFFDGSTLVVDDDVTYSQPATKLSDASANKWSTDIVPQYGRYTIDDLKKGDIIEYTTANNKADLLRILVKIDDIGGNRIDGANIQLNGNLIGDVKSVADNGKVCVVKYQNNLNNEVTQSMFVNGSVYKIDIKKNEISYSSTSDIKEGDRIFINSFWWSPKVIVILR